MQRINKPYEGLFITIEGGEGSGKSTLADRLAKELEKKGYPVMKTREPGGPSLSEHIRNLLLNPKEECTISPMSELLLFLAARAQQLDERIKPALHEGKIVICERYNDSTIVYQGCGRGLGMQYVEKICRLVCDDPDFTLFLDLNPQEGLKRIQAQGKDIDRLEGEAIQFHQDVRQGYLHLADEYPQRIAVLDATLSVDEVTSAALELLEPRLMIKKG